MCFDTIDNVLRVWLTFMYNLVTNLNVDFRFVIYVYTYKAYREQNLDISVSHTDQRWFTFTQQISSCRQLCLSFKFMCFSAKL